MIGAERGAGNDQAQCGGLAVEVSAKPARRWLYLLEDFAGTDPVAAVSHQPCMEKRRHRAQQRVVTDLLQPARPAQKVLRLGELLPLQRHPGVGQRQRGGKTARGDADLLGKPFGRLDEFFPS